MSGVGEPDADSRRIGWAALAIAALAIGRWGVAALELGERLDRVDRVGAEQQPGQPGQPGQDLAPPASERDEHEPPAPPPYTAEARALLGDLDRGDALAGWSVDRIEGTLDDGSIRVIVGRDEQRLSIWLRPKGRSEHAPPLSTARFDVFYDRLRPPEPPLDDAKLHAILEQVVARVEANE